MQTADLPPSYSLMENCGPLISAAHNEFQYLCACAAAMETIKRRRRKKNPIKCSPEHVGCTEDHIKLPTVQACSLLCHLRRFQQPRLFQQKLAWRGRENSGAVKTSWDPNRRSQGYAVCKYCLWPSEMDSRSAPEIIC